MKKVVTTISAAIFVLGLTSAGLAQTAQTPAKPEVKQESTAVQTPAAKPEVTKPGEKAGAKEMVKPGEAKKETTKEAKKVAKQAAKKDKTEKCGAPVEKSQPEKK
ncbi:MAG: hypothetical protein ACHQ2F_04160 [Desulfobaccales bacterium]